MIERSLQLPPGAMTIELNREASLEELALRSQRGSHAAFDQLVGQCQDRLFRYLLKVVNQPEDAEDLTQQTFVKFYQALSRYDSRRPVLPWLFVIAKRTALSFLRTRRPGSPVSEEEQIDCNDPAQALAGKEQGNALWTLAAQLKPPQYEALWLRYGEDFSIAETAAIMGLTAVHVKVLLHRGRIHLARLLENAPPHSPLKD